MYGALIKHNCHSWGGKSKVDINHSQYRLSLTRSKRDVCLVGEEEVCWPSSSQHEEDIPQANDNDIPNYWRKKGMDGRRRIGHQTKQSCHFASLDTDDMYMMF